MIKAAVLGSPVSHSLSPRMHTFAYKELGLAGEYTSFDLPLEEFESFFHAVDNSWTGFSLTMPLKESAFTIDAEISQSAKRIHSVNTLYRKDGKWHGVSTDESAFKRLLPAEKNSKIAILGAGGTARAAIGALDGTVAEIHVFNRTLERKGSLESAAELSAVIMHSLNDSLDGFNIVLSTLPSGVSDALVANMKVAPDLFFESLYKPLPTLLSAHARELGSQVLNGIDLLVEQGMDQVALFSGHSFDYESMRKLLIADLSDFINR